MVALARSGLAHLDAEWGAACEALAAADARVAKLDAALDRSLDRDRLDYVVARPLARWAVIGRGVLDRAYLRDSISRERSARTPLASVLGTRALATPGLRDRVPSSLLRELEAARRDADAAVEERATSLAPYGGEALPRWLAPLARQLASFARTVGEHLVRNLPAVAGMLVGWWIADSFTDSWLDGRTLWLPLLAAAFGTYLGARVGARIHGRYAAEGPSSEARASPTPDAEHAR